VQRYIIFSTYKQDIKKAFDELKETGIFSI